MIVALMRMPAGTRAEPHAHPNEQWIYVVEGTFCATIDDKKFEAKPGSVLYIPPNVVRLMPRHKLMAYSLLPRMHVMACRGRRPAERRDCLQAPALVLNLVTILSEQFGI